MVDEQITIAIMYDGIATRSNNRTMATEQNSTPTLEHTNTTFIGIGASDATRTSHYDMVGTIYTTTAHIERSKQIVIAAVMVDVGTFNPLARIKANREMVERLIGGQLLARCRIDLDEIDSIPVGA